MKLKTNLVELHELEHLDLKTTNKDGKRYYTDEKRLSIIQVLPV